MKIAVIGLWHLGLVIAASLANKRYDVIAYDPNRETINTLKKNKIPIFEPGLDDLLTHCVHMRKLFYTSNLDDICQAEIVWVTFDTPVDDNDKADVVSVIDHVTNIFPHIQNNALILISSQLPVGSTRQCEERCTQQFPHKKITFAYSPENLRLGKALDIFAHPDRIIVGLQTHSDKERITQLFKPFSQHIIWMSIESAEMTKHALNAFLAASVVFINELSTLCERVGANAYDVERGLKSEERIGPKAYLRPGHAIAGGTLARDVNYLIDIGKQQTLPTPFFTALLTSNETHKQWPCRRITDVFEVLKNKTITLLGLAYKVGTDTLRRSTAIETGLWLAKQGADVIAYDPVIKQLPHELHSCIHLKSTLHEALHNADAVIIATEWPEFLTINVDQLLSYIKYPHVFDASGFLAKNLSQDKRIEYFTVGNTR